MFFGKKIRPWAAIKSAKANKYIKESFIFFVDKFKWFFIGVFVAPLLKKIGECFWTDDYTFVKNIYSSIVSGDHSILAIISERLPSIVHFFDFYLTFAIGLILLYVVLWLALEMTRWRGGLNRYSSSRNNNSRPRFFDRICFETFFTLVNPLRLYGVCKLMHEFQHTFEKYSSMIEAGGEDKKNLEDEVFFQGTLSLLGKAKEIIDYLIKGDVAVHIKIFANTSLTGSTPKTFSLNKVKLLTYCRMPSRAEGEGRTKEEAFEVSSTRPRDIVKYIKRLSEKNKTFDEVTPENTSIPRVNSAYNYVLQHTKERHFVCNDLEYAVDKGFFFSNSVDWQEFYNSLAVFLIHPHLDFGENINEDKNAPHGMLIIDNAATGRFDAKSMKDTCGYLAHRFSEYFDLLR